MIYILVFKFKILKIGFPQFFHKFSPDNWSFFNVLISYELKLNFKSEIIILFCLQKSFKGLNLEHLEKISFLFIICQELETPRPLPKKIIYFEIYYLNVQSKKKFYYYIYKFLPPYFLIVIFNLSSVLLYIIRID